VNPLLFPTALVKRALDDLSAIADAAGRLTSLEASVVGALARVEAKLDGLREDIQPIGQLRQVREGIEPLDEDMHAVRESVDDLEPLIREVNERLGRLDERIEALRGDLSPLGDLADKVPGIGRR
jgi:predicted  nucleic acid-binding Zn-ribbon protein